MTRTPLLNASFAVLYIMGIVGLLSVTTNVAAETVLVPMFVLSLLVLSAALMAFLFFFDSLVLLVAGAPKEAARYFLKTVGWFLLFILLLGVALVSAFR